VSPLTLEASRRAVALAESVGVPSSALTLLVIPRHEDRVPLDQHRPTCDWLRERVCAGASLAMHGLTHRMGDRTRNPWHWLLAQGFARGQAEFMVCDGDTFSRRLEASRAIFRRAALEEALWGFVPPAWLISKRALARLRQAGLAFYEQFGGIVYHDVEHAHRLVGFGSLSNVEARATAAYGRWQSLRSPADTRLAIHPADMARASVTDAIRVILRSLLAKLEPLSYAEYLQRIQ
jgi:predicted deacetylase